MSLLASWAKVESDNCGNRYPIDYVLFTRFFCEI